MIEHLAKTAGAIKAQKGILLKSPSADHSETTE